MDASGVFMELASEQSKIQNHTGTGLELIATEISLRLAGM